MILAPILGAVFIPVSFLPSFAWEHCTFPVPLIENHLKYCYVTSLYEKLEDLEESKIIRTDSEIIRPTLYYWQIERFYRMFLLQSSLIYDDFTIQSAHIYNNVVDLKSANSFISIAFNTCYVINSGQHFITFSEMLPKEEVKSDAAHYLYHLKIKKETKDQKGIQHEFDLINCDFEPFTKIWYSSPFGIKKYEKGYDPKNKRKTFSTKDLVFICENIPIEDLNDERFDVHEIRVKMYQFLSNYKRIRERPVAFEKNITRFRLSTDLDIYDDTENLKFIYFNEKSEIVCQKNLDERSWPASSQLILYKTMTKIINFLLTNTSIKKILF